jgi:hypothetical protein
MASTLVEEQVRSYLDACTECAQACEACAKRCIEAAQAEPVDCTKLCMDCATLCGACLPPRAWPWIMVSRPSNCPSLPWIRTVAVPPWPPGPESITA